MNLRTPANKYKMKGLLTINILSLFFNSFACAITPSNHAKALKEAAAELALKKALAPITYAEIGDQLLASYGIVGNNNPPSEEDTENTKKLNLDIAELSDQEKLQKLYTLLAEEEIQHPSGTAASGKSNRATKTVIKDLELFYTPGEEHADHIFSRINRTQTCFGEAQLAAWLTQPTTDITILQNRQQAVQFFMDNPEEMDKAVQALDQVKQAESTIFNNWTVENQTTKKSINNLYPRILRSNPAILEAYTRFGNVVTAIISTLTFPPTLPIIQHQIVPRVLAKITNNAPNIPLFKDTLKEALHATPDYISWNYRTIRLILSPTEENVTNAFKKAFKLDSPPSFDHLPEEDRNDAVTYWNKRNGEIVKETLTQWQDKKTRIQAAVGLGITAAFLTLLTSICVNTLQAANDHKNITNYVHTNLIGMATLVQATEQMHAIAQKHPALANCLLCKDFRIGSDDYMYLNKMLQTNTFKGQASFFSLTGKVLAARTLMAGCKNEFIKYMKAIGEIDALLSLAKLMKEFENKPNGLSFVTYIQQDTPYINLTGFWNPLVNPETAVANNLEFGSHNDGNPYTCNIVLTGANTGGKSTALKAMLINMLLAHTCGIAFAKDFVLTLFAYVNSSLNIVDNTAGGKSLAQAEADRIAMLLNDAHTLQPGEHALIIGDELFRGVSAHAADQETYTCIQQLINCPNTLSIIATHTKRATNLEQETNGLSKNYRMEAIVHEDGSITTPYILEPGVNRYDIASNIVGNAIAQAA